MIIPQEVSHVLSSTVSTTALRLRTFLQFSLKKRKRHKKMTTSYFQKALHFLIITNGIVVLDHLFHASASDTTPKQS